MLPPLHMVGTSTRAGEYMLETATLLSWDVLMISGFSDPVIDVHESRTIEELMETPYASTSVTSSLPLVT